MRNYYKILLLCAFLVHSSSAQEQKAQATQKKALTALENYFALERENIHVHFDKNVFLSNEEIYFKGYVFNRKIFSPSYTTSNVYGILMDENGTKLSEKLFFATNGSFTGSFKPDKNYRSGYYYIRFFTNWMNNFNEDESLVSKIEIINEENPQRLTKPTPGLIDIDLYPEGGNFILGVRNNIGVKVSDCYGDPVSVNKLEIVNENSETIMTVFLNRFGYGKFEFVPLNQNYKAVIRTTNLNAEQTFPVAEVEGFTMQVNNFAIASKTVLKIAANPQYVNKIKNNAYTIAINRDEKTSFINFDFSNGNSEQTITFSKEFLFDGTNTIRLLDENLNELSRRMVFKFPEENHELNVTLSKNPNSEIIVNGDLPFADANLSASVLPENSKTLSLGDDIYGSLLLNPYLSDKISNASYYFAEKTTAIFFELDLILLHQRNQKYNWTDILKNPPIKKYEADFGLTIKGTFKTPLKNPKRHLVRLFSIPASLNETAEVDENNEFYFENLALSDSTSVNLTLVNVSDIKTPVDAKIIASVANGNRTFHKTFNAKAHACSKQLELLSFALPKTNQKITQLDTVTIKKQQVGKGLANENKSGNWALRGYKIDAKMQGIPLRRFLELNGFNVSYDRTGQMIISGRRPASLNANSVTTPIIYIDDVQQFSLMQLEYLRMDQLEEIYINAHYGFPGINRHEGIIKFYTKKAGNFIPMDYKGNATVFKVLDGFEKNHPFKNPNYNESEGYEHLGIIQWIPNVNSTETGRFNFSIPTTGRKSAKILIEGINPDGKLISKIVTVDLSAVH